MSAAAKSRQLISAQNLVGSMQISSGSRLTRSDGFDLDFEFGPRKTLNDHQSRRWGRIAHEFVTHLHVAAQIMRRRDISVQADQVRERHRRFAKDCDYGVKAETRLSLHIIRDDPVATNSQLAGAEDDTRSRLDFYAVRIVCKGGMDRLRVQ